MLVYLLQICISFKSCVFLSVSYVCLVAWWSTTLKTWTRKRSTARCAASQRPSRASATGARRTWMSQSDRRERGTMQWVITFSSTVAAFSRIFLLEKLHQETAVLQPHRLLSWWNQSVAFCIKCLKVIKLKFDFIIKITPLIYTDTQVLSCIIFCTPVTTF